MATFTDSTGRDWQLELTAGDLKRIKREAGVDLRDALKPGGQSFTDKLDDPDTFLSFMWVVFGHKAAAVFEWRDVEVEDPETGERSTRRVSPRDQFEAIFDRDTTVAAVAAVWESTWDFFRGRKAGAEARQSLLAAVGEVEGATVTVLTRATAKLKAGPTSNDSVNSSAESSVSTTDPLPSAS